MSRETTATGAWGLRCTKDSAGGFAAGLLLVALGLQACAVATPASEITQTATLQTYASPTVSATSFLPDPATATLPPPGPSPTPFVHTVAEGDTLIAIALKYGLGLDELLAANPEVDPRFLSLGQEIRIPGPGGDAWETLLPTSTPVPLALGEPACYPTGAGGVWCLVTAENSTDTPLEGLAAQFGLYTASGRLLSTQAAYSALNLLPPGQALPLAAFFDVEPAGFDHARVGLISAFEALEIEDRYVPYTLSELRILSKSDPRRWRLEGLITLGEHDQAEVRLSVLAMGLDAGGRVVGFTKTESQLVPEDGDEIDFSMAVHSLGPAFQSVEILAEARTVE